MVVLSGELEDVPAQSLMQMLAHRHPRGPGRVPGRGRPRLGVTSSRAPPTRRSGSQRELDARSGDAGRHLQAVLGQRRGAVACTPYA